MINLKYKAFTETISLKYTYFKSGHFCVGSSLLLVR